MKKITLISFVLPIFLSACLDNNNDDEIKNRPAKVVHVSNLATLKTTLTPYQYTFDDWNNGIQEVPRLTFSGITPAWQKLIQSVPVENKKSIFFRLMLPSILLSNEKILTERAIVKEGNLQSPALRRIALKYRVIKSEDAVLTDTQQQILLKRVNTIPPSLALAQAAEESGWGTSRFVSEGNAFFGQWDFSGNGIKPKQQRKELGNYGIARFESPLESVQAYMLNINTASAYQSLRDLRAQRVKENKAVTGTLLAGTLLKYSERGEAYITGLRHLIAYNKLNAFDHVVLSDNQLLHLTF